MRVMALYPLDHSNAIDRRWWGRFARSGRRRLSSTLQSGSFTVAQFRQVSAAYAQRAEQAANESERREYSDLRRHFGEQAENAQWQEDAAQKGRRTCAASVD
jgi:hypothetical protein